MRIITKTKLVFKNIATKVNNFLAKYPLGALGVTLVILLGLIALSNFLQTPNTNEEVTETSVKQVQVYSVGDSTRYVEQAGTIKKSNVIKIYAQTSGIVNFIYAPSGSSVTQGQSIISLASNYSGANSAAISKQIAQAQYNNLSSTYDSQKQIINNQIDLANTSNALADDLREISKKSLDETEELLKLNEGILSQLDQNIAELEASNSGGSNDALILSTKQLKSQFLTAVNGNKTAIANLQLDTNNENLNKTIADINKKVAIEQLNIQKQSLDLSLEVAQLQLKLAQINESLMFPSTPFNGTVEKLEVRAGDNVSAGDLIATVSSNNASDNNAQIEVLVTREVANQVSKTQPSLVVLGGQTIETTPSYVSNQATNGQLYTVFYNLTGQQLSGINVSDLQTVSVRIPFGYADTTNVAMFVPIDAIHQTNEKSFVFVTNGENVANAAEINVKDITGNFAQIEGLEGNAQIILNRSVLDGDKVEVI